MNWLETRGGEQSEKGRLEWLSLVDFDLSVEVLRRVIKRLSNVII